MARIDRPVRIVGLLALASCMAPAWRDLSDPVSVDDRAALPAAVTPENARGVVRRCLQRHRDSATNAHHRYGYAFREGGFVQLYSLAGVDRGRELHVRTFVDFAAVDSATSETFVDNTRLRRSFRVILRGTFRRWDARPTPYVTQPEIGSEPGTSAIDSLELVLDEGVAALRLVEALTLLSRP